MSITGVNGARKPPGLRECPPITKPFCRWVEFTDGIPKDDSIMCGIAGILHPNSETVRAAIPKMNYAQRHRGPDDGGMEFIEPDGFAVGLGHRRLAIIDVSTAGHQPMNDADT